MRPMMSVDSCPSSSVRGETISITEKLNNTLPVGPAAKSAGKDCLPRSTVTETIRDCRISLHHAAGMKQRIEVPSGPFIGQTIVLPARFGSESRW
jgi:hypothetical protein